MNMIERVARAIDDISNEQSLAFFERLPSDNATIRAAKEADLEKRMQQARAAIYAIRPTEADLLKAGCDNDTSGAPYCVDCSYLAEQFGKFMDECLKS